MCSSDLLNCKQQTFALSKAHEVSNTNIKRDINNAILPLVETAHPRPYTFLSLVQGIKGGMNPLSSINTPSWRYTKSLGQSNYAHRRACKNINSSYKNHAQSEHNFIIHRIPANTSHSITIIDLDHVRQLTRS